MKIMKRQKNKSGSMLALVALGVLAVGGIVPFLVENSETNQKLTNSIDETNKQIWTLQSAVRNASQNNTNNNLGLKDVTTREVNKPVLNFYYGDKEKGFKSEAQVTCVNAYLNKNQVFVGNIHDKDGYDLSSIKYSEVKPGTTVINNTTYVWDKYGKLYELENNKLVQKTVPGKVWQLVSDGVNPVVLTDDFKAVNLKDNKEYGNNYYQFAARSDAFQAAINKDNTFSAVGNKNATANLPAALNAQDIAVSPNHGLALFNNGSNWEVWGWGSNSNNQLVCTSTDANNKEAEDNYQELTKISDIFRKCKASGNTGAVIDISPFKDIELSDNKNSIIQYFTEHYKDIKTHNMSSNSYYNKGQGNVTCDCDFCKDVCDVHTGSNNLHVPFTVTELDTEISHLELLVDISSNNGGSKNYFGDSKNRYSQVKCEIYDQNNNLVHSISGGLLDTSESFEKYNKIGVIKWKDNLLKNSNGEYYSLPGAGQYYMKFKVGSKDDELQPCDLFYGWIDPEKRKNGNGNINTSTAYGGIFRMNHNLYNLNGGTATYGYDVNFYAIAAGNDFSLAVVSPKETQPNIANYSVIGWGRNNYGQIGSGKVTDKNEEMTLIASSTLPSATVENYRDMQAGNNHALFLTKSGKVYSWGGSNDNASVYNVHQVSFKNNPKIVYISAGNGFSSALDEDGNLYSWSVIQGQTGSVVNPISGINTSLFSTK